MTNKDKELLEVYIWGFNDELEGKQKMWNPNPLLLKAYNLGRDHAIIADDVRTVDYLSNEEILNIIKNGKLST